MGRPRKSPRVYAASFTGGPWDGLVLQVRREDSHELTQFLWPYPDLVPASMDRPHHVYELHWVLSEQGTPLAIEYDHLLLDPEGVRKALDVFRPPARGGPPPPGRGRAARDGPGSAVFLAISDWPAPWYPGRSETGCVACPAEPPEEGTYLIPDDVEG